MKPTVTQVYQSAATILSGILANQCHGDFDTNMGYYTEKAVEMALILAEKVPETDVLPDSEPLRKFFVQVFAEVNGRPISKGQLSMLMQDRLHIGKRNTEHALLWAENSKLLNADVKGNGIFYTLA